MSGGRLTQRVRPGHVDWLAERFSHRDWAIVADLDRVRLLSGAQLERLHFADLSGRSRSVVRWRVLKRLVDWRVLLPLARRIGGTTPGSSGMAFTLDTAGQLLAHRHATDPSGQPRPRRPATPGDRFVRHVLTVSELYVQLVEAARIDDWQLAEFWAEPDAWLPDGLGGWLKPDAYAVLAAGEIEDCWAIEVDKATEHLPTLQRKFESYLDFMQRGQLGPHGVMPRVLITVPDDQRRHAVHGLLERLPEPAGTLFHITTEDRAVRDLVQVLRE